MKKLGLVAVAASSVLIPAAMAQTVPDPHPHYGVPSVGSHPGPAPHAAVPASPASPPGHSWREGGAQAQMQHRAPPQMRHEGPRMEMRQQTHGVDRGSHDGGRRFAHIRRIDRGGMVPHDWVGQRYHVRNWSLYGFPQPFGGGRWVRYYDDALLIDPYGRVYDGRYGLDWDRYGEAWGYDDSGVPAYVGDGDFEPDDRDYEWAEDYERGEDLADDEGYENRPHGYAQPGYGGYGYGYGWGPVLVTETIVTTAPVVESVTRYEYVREKVRPAIRSKHRRAVRHAPPPPPHDGEKG